MKANPIPGEVWHVMDGLWHEKHWCNAKFDPVKTETRRKNALFRTDPFFGDSGCGRIPDERDQ